MTTCTPAPRRRESTCTVRTKPGGASPNFPTTSQVAGAAISSLPLQNDLPAEDDCPITDSSSHYITPHQQPHTTPNKQVNTAYDFVAKDGFEAFTKWYVSCLPHTRTRKSERCVCTSLPLPSGVAWTSLSPRIYWKGHFLRFHGTSQTHTITHKHTQSHTQSPPYFQCLTAPRLLH